MTLKQLGTSYLDLYLIVRALSDVMIWRLQLTLPVPTATQHWPVPFQPGETLSPTTPDGKETIIDTEAPSIVETWKAVIELYKAGKVKAIGVSSPSPGCCCRRSRRG